MVGRESLLYTVVQGLELQWPLGTQPCKWLKELPAFDDQTGKRHVSRPSIPLVIAQSSHHTPEEDKGDQKCSLVVCTRRKGNGFGEHLASLSHKEPRSVVRFCTVSLPESLHLE